MSLDATNAVDPASREAGDGHLTDFKTDGIPAGQRLAFWRDGVLRRMVPLEGGGAGRPFRARLRRIEAAGVEMVEHASDAVFAERTEQRCRIDACDDIGIDLMRDCKSASIEHNGEHRQRPGELHVMDYAQPAQMLRSRHRACAIVLPRSRVNDVLGNGASSLAGRTIAARGMAGVLRQHLATTVDEAPHMSPAERALAVKAAADMVLAIFQTGRLGTADTEQFGAGFYRAARALIERECTDPELTPDRIAQMLGCSRASLYRVFSRHGESVAVLIWSARVERAWRMLTSGEGIGMLVSDIAQHCGFLEMPTFTRMFRRRYGMTPRDARELVSA